MDIASVIQGGAANPWVFLPAAVALGAIHGLEPGHAKSMMAAFVVAVRGTVTQAVLLGLSAAFSHSLVVWLLAAIGLWMGDALIGETAEPYLHLIGGFIVVGMAVWMILRIYGFQFHWRMPEKGHSHHGHDHGHSHDHGACGCGHSHDGKAEANKLLREGKVGTGQIMLFGLTGGLMPCPASIAVLLVCLQLKQFTLGAAMVGAFSIGLALTLVSVGVLAAWGRGHVERLYGAHRAEKLSRYLPLGSAALMLVLGGIMMVSGIIHL